MIRYLNNRVCKIIKTRHTLVILSSLRFLRVRISFVRFLVSSIFFHVFISSYFSSAIRFANNKASLSILQINSKRVVRLLKEKRRYKKAHLLFTSFLDLGKGVRLSLEHSFFLLESSLSLQGHARGRLSLVLVALSGLSHVGALIIRSVINVLSLHFLTNFLGFS